MKATDPQPSGVCLFERLEVIDDPQPRSAPFNMAADEALLEQLGEVPVLRIYRWQRPAISFGFFTNFDAVRKQFDQRELVRRWTGGGMVEHGADFTYSLVIPRRELAALGAPGRSYELIHRALATALAMAGLPAEPAFAGFPPGDGAGMRRGQTGARSARESHCFEHPVAYDLMIGGRKTAGAAQRRTRRGLLHQGSMQGLGDGIAPDWRERLAELLPGALCASRTKRRLTLAEELGATRLAQEKYATRAWLRRF